MLRLAPSLLFTTGSRFVVTPTVSYRGFGMEAPKKIPGYLEPYFQYGSESYITQGIQGGIELIHSMDVPWIASFVISGLVLRVLTIPFHVASERMLAKRFHISNYFVAKMFQRISENHQIPIKVDTETNKPVFSHPNEQVNQLAHSRVEEAIATCLSDQRLGGLRIQLMKTCTVPIWVASSFAIRNILTSDFGVHMPGVGWIGNFLEPDPYFILPVCVCLLGFLNCYSQRMVVALPGKKKLSLKVYDGLLGLSFALAFIIMPNMPACILLYWVVIASTGFVESLALRHPRVRKLLGIKPLPWDSKTPFRDLVFLRKRQML